MRRAAWGLLLLFVFAIPWEYSLDMGEPLGNVARIAGVAVLLVAIPAVLQAGRLRTPGAQQWVVLAFYLWWRVDWVCRVRPLRWRARCFLRRRPSAKRHFGFQRAPT